MLDPVTAFCADVIGQLRCHWEAQAVADELRGHIDDHTDALLARGLSRGDAQARAVAAMGDPVELGRALDRLHSPWPWRVLHFCTRAAVLALILLALALFGGLSNAPRPLELPALLPSYREARAGLVQAEQPVLGSGTVTGSGRVGDYRLSAHGDAVLYAYPDYPEESPALAFLVSADHLQPWLDDFDCPWYALSAVDDLGNRYTYEDVTFYPRTGGVFRAWCDATVYGLDPGARQVTLTLDTDRGQVRFTAVLDGEVTP